jgi:alpha-tubulin suppressor-like RCC1 family protein
MKTKRNLIQICLLCAVLLQAVTSGAQPVTKVAAGGEHSLFLKSDGSLWAMGENAEGQLGDGTYNNTNRPEQIVAANVTAIAGGYDHSLFLKSDGSLWAMGENAEGQLGDSTYNNTNRPEQIVATNVMAIAAGSDHSLFLKRDGSLWAMGYNGYGELGDGTYGTAPYYATNRPELIVASNVTAIAAGGSHSLFLMSDGSLWAMGNNQYGQLGDGTYNNTNRPEQIVATNVTAIAAGGLHSLFLKSDGSLWAIGDNQSGELGDGTSNSSTNRPEQIVATNVTAIAAGGIYSLFLKSDGSLWAMGDNYYGQLGDGTYNQTNQPEQIVATNVTAIAAGEYHSLFLESDGSLWAMGANTQGQLGNVTYNQTNRPELIVAGSIETVPPTNQITAPTPGLQVSNASYTVTGKAGDNVLVSDVWYQLNNTGWNLASSTNHWTNWTAVVTLTPGTNIVQAFAVDTSGNVSTTNSVSFVYVLSAVLTVQTNGNGTISPNYNGALLQIGQNYSMTATAASGFAFVNWTGSTTTNGATLQFTMASNLTFTANFVDVTKPTLTISSPTSGQQISNAVFTVTGTATDNVAVSNVLYSLNNAAWADAVTANNWVNWTAAVNLIAGNNTIRAYAVDTSGNISATNSVSFVAVLSSVLTVHTNGNGTVSPNYNGVLLQIGNTYSITATAGTGFMFTNWTGGTGLPLGVLTNGTTVQFQMVANLMLQANFVDTIKPTVSITNLAAGQRVSNAVFTVKGTASDNWQVSNVVCQINGGGWNLATNINNWTNWAAGVTLVPGTNVVQACAADTTGNKSTTNSVSFQFVVTNQLGVRALGLGTISPNYSNVWLEIGRNYSMAATPGSGFVFTNWLISTNWLGGTTTNNATVQFMMKSNLTLQVSFVDVTRPTLHITAPTSGQKMTNALANVKGTANDNWGVTNVWYQLNGGSWSLATSTNGWTNWTVTLTLVSGTNTVKAYAVDLGANLSTTNSVSFVSSNMFQLQLGFAVPQPMTSTGLNFNLQVSLGLNGRIETSTNLVNWVTLTNFVGTNSTLNFRDPAATNFNNRFYRAVTP